MLTKHPFLAILFSALIAPGLGQILTGRLAKGALMLAVLALCVPALIIKIGHDLASSAELLLDESWTGAERLRIMQQTLAPHAGDILWFCLPLVALWFWSVTDALFFALRSGRK